MSEMVDAMRLAFGVRKYTKPIACCPNCESPLVQTIVFPQAEFYCLDCGETCSFVSPVEGDPDDDDLTERMNRYGQEWKDNVHYDQRERTLTPESFEWINERKVVNA